MLDRLLTGPRSGRRYLIPVGWHEVDGRPSVFSPARWTRSFRDGTAVVVHHRGRARRYIGTLVTDREAVAASLRSLVASGRSLGDVGLRAEPGHVVVAEDLADDHDRALITFVPA